MELRGAEADLTIAANEYAPQIGRGWTIEHCEHLHLEGHMSAPLPTGGIWTRRAQGPSFVLVSAMAVLALASCGGERAPGRRHVASQIRFLRGCCACYGINTDGSGITRLSDLCGERGTWSPDGAKLADVVEDLATGQEPTEIVVSGVGGSGRILFYISPATDDSDPAWSPDGTKLAFASRGDIYVINADGSGLRNLTNERALLAWDPAWSRDGTRLAFVSRWDIYVVNADGSGVMRLTDHPAWDANPRWSPDGTKLAFLSERDDTLRRVDRRKEIYAINADGSGLRNLTNDPADDCCFAWSPDGSKLAFVSDRRGDKEIYIVNSDGSGLTQYGFQGAEDTDPAWSLDGAMLAFASRVTGDFDIYVMNADGSGLRSLTDDPADDRFPVWLPASQPSATPTAAGAEPPTIVTPESVTESFGPRFAALDSALAPVLAALDSAQARLRRDSGTARADSAFVAFGDGYVQRVPYWGDEFEEWLQSDRAARDSAAEFYFSRGLILNVSEGTYWLTANSGFLLRRLGAYLTRPMRSYVEILERQQEGMYESDGGLLISWDELAERIIAWEAFLEGNPGFALRGDAENWYDRYLGAYVSGLENTPLFDSRPPLGPYGTGRLRGDVRASYERLVARHGQTQAARFVRGLLEVLQRVGYSDGPEREEYLRTTPRPTPGRRRPGG
ncbi:MAG: PD40 domain-containing protein [Gemmatimonadetes bacterium]|nr:PD40 domain-containing protein [Gemmatimonadota bacterium]